MTAPCAAWRMASMCEMPSGVAGSPSWVTIIRAAVLAAHPEIADLLAVVSERLTDDLMQELNGRVDIEGEDPSDVAYEWLKSEDLVT